MDADSSMRNFWAGAFVVFILAAAFIYFELGTTSPRASDHHQNEEQVVRSRVEAFGANFKMVPLLAPTSTLEAALDQYYGDFVAPELIATWKANHLLAPGREVSS